jgi:RNA polymerase sigma factor (sigma-70 family)
MLVNSLISEALRYHAGGQSRVTREDLEDIAAEKSLQVMRKIELGEWEVADRQPAEVRGYLSKVARNGLVDWLRAVRRFVEPSKDEPREWPAETADPERVAGVMSTPVPPDDLVEGTEFIQALRACAGRLEPRSRLVWFLRVLCGMSGKEIATHPRVSLRAGHVNVLLQRTREKMRQCMKAKGHEPRDMPVGAFVRIWEICQFDEIPSLGELEHESPTG